MQRFLRSVVPEKHRALGAAPSRVVQGRQVWVALARGERVKMGEQEVPMPELRGLPRWSSVMSIPFGRR